MRKGLRSKKHVTYSWTCPLCDTHTDTCGFTSFSFPFKRMPLAPENISSQIWNSMSWRCRYVSQALTVYNNTYTCHAPPYRTHRIACIGYTYFFDRLLRRYGRVGVDIPAKQRQRVWYRALHGWLAIENRKKEMGTGIIGNTPSTKCHSKTYKVRLNIWRIILENVRHIFDSMPQ